MSALDPSTLSQPVRSVRLTLIGKPDCHLCDVAQGVIDEVLGALDSSFEISLEKRSILDDPLLNEKYWEKIPVLLIDGREHAHWHVNANRLRRALEGTN